MKWGVRRFQNKNGKLTSRGKKRYSAETERAREAYKESKSQRRKAYIDWNKKSLGGIIVRQEDIDELGRSMNKEKVYKNRYKESKDKDRMRESDAIKGKSKRRTELEKRYMKSGMDREAAELAAYRRVRTEKAVAAVAGVTAVAVAAHLARKYYHRNVDQVIKEGTVIQNVRNHPMEDLGIPFYGSSSKLDNMKYRGMLGKQINGYSRSGVIANNIKATANIKRASDKTGARTLGKLLGDKSYTADLKKHLSETPILSDETKRKVLSELEQGRVGKHTYRAFNQALIDHGNPASDRVINGFYDSLKKAGYGAVSDYNDREASGYGSKTATIFFDGAKQLSKVGSRKLTDAEISSDAGKSITLLAGKAAAQQFGAFGAGYAGVTVAKRYVEQKAIDKAVKNYKRKHPKTKMSYSEIKKMLEEESYARK